MEANRGDPVAAARRRLGGALIAWRESAGISQTELARRINYDRSSVSHTERGGQTPAADFWRACDTVLNTGGELASLHLTWWTAKQHRLAADQARRRATRLSSRSQDHPHRPPLPTASTAVDGPSPLDLQSAPAHVTVGGVAAIRAVLDALASSERQLGGAGLREHTAAYLRTVIQPRLHAPADEAVRDQLFTVATEFALRLSSMHLDAGDLPACRALLATAAGLAHQTDDPSLIAWVLARRGEQDVHEHRVEPAVAFTAGAVTLARHAPPGSLAFVLGKHALALSLTGDRAATLTTLGQAHDACDQRGRRPEPPWMGRYHRTHLRHDEARCYANLGLGTRAVRAAEDCLRDRAGGADTRPRAFTLGIHAIGHTHNRQIEQACHTARELTTLTRQLASERVRLRLAETLTALRPYRRLTPVRDLYELARPVVGSPNG
jgi:hypothetical protein